MGVPLINFIGFSLLQHPFGAPLWKPARRNPHRVTRKRVCTSGTVSGTSGEVTVVTASENCTEAFMVTGWRDSQHLMWGCS